MAAPEPTGPWRRPSFVDDSTLMAQFRSTELPLDQWNHRLHLRLAFIFLREYSFPTALSRFRAALRAYNEAHSVPDHLASGYHETLTVAWLSLVASRLSDSQEIGDFSSFCSLHPELLACGIMTRTHWAFRPSRQGGAR